MSLETFKSIPSRMRLMEIALWVIIAAAAFHTAYAWQNASFLALLYLFALVRLAQASTWRKAFYSGLAVGFLVAIVRLAFFGRIFGAGAAVLWFVYAFWIALFVALAGLCFRRFGPQWGCLLLPFLWTGLEYFRSELYYLRFSWLSPGYAFGPLQARFHSLGTYGTAFLLMCPVAAAAFLWSASRFRGLAAISGALACLWFWGLVPKAQPAPATATGLQVAGIQMEFPAEAEVLLRLEETLRKFPGTQLIVLSEYTFDDAVPEKVKAWCRKHQRYLIVGGKDHAPNRNFYNTAFVIGPTGEVIFRQVKAVPIQFFKDGLAAPVQQPWDSPWGKIGICICYDLSYTRVTDRLIEKGARALIVPTMDVADWGRGQHELHARIAPVRAAEYGIPVFRLASSGISQCVDPSGRMVATAPCPGEGAVLVAKLSLGTAGTLPLDRWLAPFSTFLTAALALWLAVSTLRETWQNHKGKLMEERIPSARATSIPV